MFPSATAIETQFLVDERVGSVSALLLRPIDARWMLLLGHGAGAGMRHRFMESIAGRLADRKVATFRYQFPYMELRRARPDAVPVLLAALREALIAVTEAAGDLPLLAGGKSMGGRITSMDAAEGRLPQVKGLVFFGYPLHPAGRPGIERAEHLGRVPMPMLFLQGTRDKLADLSLLEPVCEKLGAGATLNVVDSADHGFHVLKRSGRTDEQVLDELADATVQWATTVCPPAAGGR